MSEEIKNQSCENLPTAFRWRKLSFNFFRRVKSDREKFRNFFGQSIDAEPQLPETGKMDMHRQSTIFFIVLM